MKIRHGWISILLCLLLAVLAGCGGTSGTAAPASPTATPKSMIPLPLYTAHAPCVVTVGKEDKTSATLGGNWKRVIWYDAQGVEIAQTEGNIPNFTVVGARYMRIEVEVHSFGPPLSCFDVTVLFAGLSEPGDNFGIICIFEPALTKSNPAGNGVYSCDFDLNSIRDLNPEAGGQTFAIPEDGTEIAISFDVRAGGAYKKAPNGEHHFKRRKLRA